MTIEKRAYTITEFCDAFSVGKSKVYEEIKAGRMKVRMFGAKKLITKDDADLWLKNLPLQAAE
jgi:excisionase family DNA binding protein